MRRTPEQLYEYESKRIETYKREFQEALEELDIDLDTYDRLKQLFEWYGHARSIKSKAYQEMKQQ